MQKLCEISNAISKLETVFSLEKDMDCVKNRMYHVESYASCEFSGQGVKKSSYSYFRLRRNN